MRVVVNGEPSEVADDASVASVVAALLDGNRGVAVAVDGEVVPQSAWASTTLATGQSVEIVKAVQGG
jgi:sulfur carrier protein